MALAKYLAWGVSVVALAPWLTGCTSGGSSNPGPGPQDFNVNVSSNSASVVQGATSAPISVTVAVLNGFSGSVSISLSGIPAGVTSSPASPFNVAAGTTQSVTFSASTSAAAGDANINVQGTSGSLSHSSSLTLHVLSSVPLLRSTYVRIDATRGSDSVVDEPDHQMIAYDPTHKHIFVANRQLSRIEVLSSVDGSRVTSLPVPLPSSVDLSPDGSRVWVGTSVEEIDAIDTATLSVAQRLPIAGIVPQFGLHYTLPQGLTLTSNGQALVNLRSRLTTGSVLAKWNPVSNTFADITPAQLRPSVGPMVRSGDYTKVLVGSEDTGGWLMLYDAGSDTFSKQVQYFGSIPTILSANPTGTQFAACLQAPGAATFVVLLDANLTELARFNAGLVAGMVYSRDGKFLYYSDNSMQLNAPPLVRVVDAQTRQQVGQIPDVGFSALQDIDETGMIFGLFNHGVTLLDAARPSALSAPAPAFNAPPAVNPPQGSTSGGTAVTIGGANFGTIGGVFFGAQATNATVAGAGAQINATSPPGSAGPVNVSAFFTNGWFALAPDGFSYGPTVLQLFTTAGRPVGGDTLQVFGYGFGTSASQIRVTIGGRDAAVTQVLGTQQTSNQLFFPPGPFPIQRLDVTTPPGTPGPQDVTVTTPAGSITVPGAFRYLQRLTVFPRAGTLKFLAYDQKRQHIYLSNTSQVEVFDLTSEQYLTPLVPPNGPLANSDLRALTLTPDAGKLLVADFGAHAVHVFTLNPPASAVSVAIPDPGAPASNGPARLAATSTGKVFVAQTFSGSGFCSCLDQIDLATLGVSVVQQNGSAFRITESALLEGDAAGDLVYMSLGDISSGPIYVWDAASNSFRGTSLNAFHFDAAVSADGNVFVTGGGGSSGGTLFPVLVDRNLRLFSNPLYLDYLFPGLGVMPGQALHPSGSLLYQPSQFFNVSGVDLVDVHTTVLRERVLFTEPLATALTAMDGDFLTLDENGKRLFAITRSGLTLAELAAVPLGIGSVQPSQGPAAGGTQVTVRGSGFQNGATVTLGTLQVMTTFVDQNTLRITTPAMPGGQAPLVVTNPNGQNYTLDAAFTYN
jgi:hypothetical protein